MTDLTEAKYTIVNWVEIDRWVEVIVEKIIKSDFYPDIVIGMTRGGWIPARLICDHLILKELYALKTEHWGMTATPDGMARLIDAPAIDLKKKKVLVVDDITDTGQSLKLALSTLSSYYPESIKSVTLLHISHSSTIPDFYAKEIKKNEWSWFIFPWNFREDVYNIVSRYADNGYDSENIQKKMYKDHGIKVKKELIDELTAMKKRKS